MVELDAEIDELTRLVDLARRTQRTATETKFEQLRDVIGKHIAGTAEKLLVFTEHKDTLDFLVGKITDLGFRVTQIHGGMSLEKRIAAEREFFETAQIMVATEAAGEGINLQFCALMMNYDIPWAPVRLEQRMGRIHRYRQQKEVMIYNLVARNTREGAVLGTLLTKLERMREALGSDRVYDVIGDIIPTPKLDQLMRDWLASRRTMDEILADPALELKPADIDAFRADMENNALGSRYIDLSKLEADMQRSREERLMPEYIERFVGLYKIHGFARCVLASRYRPSLCSFVNPKADRDCLPRHQANAVVQGGDQCPTPYWVIWHLPIPGRSFKDCRRQTDYRSRILPPHAGNACSALDGDRRPSPRGENHVLRQVRDDAVGRVRRDHSQWDTCLNRVTRVRRKHSHLSVNRSPQDMGVDAAYNFLQIPLPLVYRQSQWREHWLEQGDGAYDTDSHDLGR
jgi:hypothetical protein